MSWFADLPIRRKLTAIVLATCSGALLLACAVLGVYEVRDFQRSLARDMTVLADVAGRNSRAALAFADEAAASRTLATLAAEPAVVAAGLYSADGGRFAEYVGAGRSVELPAAPGEDGYRFENGSLLVFRPIEIDGSRVGTIHLRASLGGINARLRLLGAVTGVTLLGSLLVAIALSNRLQRSLTDPILELAHTARAIADENDFSVRARQGSRDEVGTLTVAFNEMLSGIEDRERALHDANQALSRENLDRRVAEKRVRSQVSNFELLNGITHAIGQRQDLPSIFHVVLRSLEDDLAIDFGCVCLYEAADEALTVTSVAPGNAATGAGAAYGRGDRLPDFGDEGRRRDFLYIEDTLAAPTLPIADLAANGLRSVVLAPLVLESESFGVLMVARRANHAFTPDECQFLRQLSEHVALAAHQAHLYGALRLAYDDLRRTQQAVMQQERLRALGEMASGIAHDINNAISPVTLYADMLMQEKDLSPRARRHLEITKRAVDDVAATVARMSDFYRLREPQLAVATVVLQPLLQQVVELTRARWKAIPLQRGVVIRMVTEPDSRPAMIVGVESELREALTNLVFNAVDALPDGGTITLRARPEDPTPPGQEPARAARMVLEVSDNGVGMSEETRRRCLEPFFTTKGDRGTGLGLAMVYGAVRRHGGDIEIDSAPAEGTTVRMAFPVPRETFPGLSRVAEPARAHTRRLRILAVDDDPLVLQAIRDALEGDGHIVAAVEDGAEAIATFAAAHAKGEAFAAVITDLGMPHMDGRQVAAAIRKQSPETPVILLTGWGQLLQAEGGPPPNVDRVLGKPPKLGELRDALAEFCGP